MAVGLGIESLNLSLSLAVCKMELIPPTGLTSPLRRWERED